MIFLHRFRHPEGVATNHEGYVFVADTGNHAIRMITPSGLVSTVAGTGRPGFRDGSISTEVEFSNPSGIGIWQSTTRSSTDEQILLFIVDSGNHRIRKISGFLSLNKETLERQFVNFTIECFCGNCDKSPQAGYADGNGNEARFDNPIGISVGETGIIYVTDTNNHLIRMIDQSGQVTTLAGKLRVAEVNKNGERLEGCPDPCLTGSQGHVDGELSLAKFSYPLGIALSSDESYLLVTSRHYLRKIDLTKRLVATTNGNDRESEADGQGRDASFNKPHGVTMTKDGYAFIVDSASCRIRRAAGPGLFSSKLSCMETVGIIFRASGCFSYNTQMDQHGLKATSRAGYIQFNYEYFNWTNKELGKDYIGRGVKNCVGTPPTDSLDKKTWDDQTLVVDDNLIEVREDPNEGTLIQVACPTNCTIDQSMHSVVYGINVAIRNSSTTLYTEESPICIAAVHAGLINSSQEETYLNVVLHRSIKQQKNDYSFVYYFNSKVEEKIDKMPEARRLYSLKLTSQDFVVQTISGLSSSKRDDFCGFQDAIPAQDAKVSYG